MKVLINGLSKWNFYLTTTLNFIKMVMTEKSLKVVIQTYEFEGLKWALQKYKKF